MSQESLAECLLSPQWYNSFPRVRYTERPDAAAATVLRALLIITDNSPRSSSCPPACWISYRTPTISTFHLWWAAICLVRILIFAATLLITPVWLPLVTHPDWLPPWLAFLQVEEPGSSPIVTQLIFIELIIDAPGPASLNTPSAEQLLQRGWRADSGGFRRQDGLVHPFEVVLYMAFVAIANFTQSSFELGVRPETLSDAADHPDSLSGRVGTDRRVGADPAMSGHHLNPVGPQLSLPLIPSSTPTPSSICCCAPGCINGPDEKSPCL